MDSLGLMRCLVFFLVIFQPKNVCSKLANCSVYSWKIIVFTVSVSLGWRGGRGVSVCVPNSCLKRLFFQYEHALIIILMIFHFEMKALQCTQSVSVSLQVQVSTGNCCRCAQPPCVYAHVRMITYNDICTLNLKLKIL